MGVTALLEGFFGKKIQGERCLTPLQKEADVWFDRATELTNLFFGEDAMQAGMAFFLNLCKKWMQFARFFFKV